MRKSRLVLLAVLVPSLGASGAVITVGDLLVSNNLLGGASDASYSEPGAFGGSDTLQPDS